MEPRLKLILGCSLALLLGLTISIPILLSNLTPATEMEIGVDVVYAYFGVQDSNRSITGLWRNQSDPWESHIVSYLIILNITNHSNELATMDDFEVAAASEILIQNGTTRIGSEKMGFSSNCTSSSGTNCTGLGISIVNPIVVDERPFKWILGFDQYWSANESRLIGLSGLVEVQGNAFPVLTSGVMYLLGKVEGGPLGQKSQSTGFSLKHVPLQTTGKEYLYNIVLAENQMLRMDGLDVSIETRR